MTKSKSKIKKVSKKKSIKEKENYFILDYENNGCQIFSNQKISIHYNGKAFFVFFYSVPTSDISILLNFLYDL